MKRQIISKNAYVNLEKVQNLNQNIEIIEKYMRNKQIFNVLKLLTFY